LRAASCATRRHRAVLPHDIDDAIEDITWIKEHGLRGGVLLPTVRTRRQVGEAARTPDYDRLWAVLEDLEVPVNLPLRNGLARLRTLPVDAHDQLISEVGFYGMRAFVHIAAVGRVRAASRASSSRSQRSARLPPLLAQLDQIIAK